MWLRGKTVVYDMKMAIHLHDSEELVLYFIVKNIANGNYISHEKLILKLAVKTLIIPIVRQDYQPRLTSIEKFKEFSGGIFKTSHVEKFFRTCYLASLAAAYEKNPAALEYRKPVHNGLLTRLLEFMGKMWQMSKSFADTFHINPMPICICDQEIDHKDIRPDDLGNIIVLLTYKNPSKYGKQYEMFRW
tara:strand:+ start:17 stop:583 length:567 start_codon:yes stop_codon:yes gene_type:complete